MRNHKSKKDKKKMARVSSLLSFSLTLLVLFHGYTAQQFPNECQLDQLNALEPSHVLKSEAGRIEVWDHHAPQLRCSGVSFARYVIESKGLYLPSFFNTAKLSFVAKGTYESFYIEIRICDMNQCSLLRTIHY